MVSSIGSNISYGSLVAIRDWFASRRTVSTNWTFLAICIYLQIWILMVCCAHLSATDRGTQLPCVFWTKDSPFRSAPLVKIQKLKTVKMIEIRVWKRELFRQNPPKEPIFTEIHTSTAEPKRQGGIFIFFREKPFFTGSKPVLFTFYKSISKSQSLYVPFAPSPIFRLRRSRAPACPPGMDDFPFSPPLGCILCFC